MSYQELLIAFGTFVLMTSVSHASKVGPDIKFEITPKTFKPLLTDNLTMRCGITSATNHLSSIHISKDGFRVAAVSHRYPASYFGKSADVEVTSHLSENSGFLQLVFNYPSDHQSGSYQCAAALLDQRGHHHDVSKTANVTSDKVTSADLIAEIRDVNKKTDKLNTHVYFSAGVASSKTSSSTVVVFDKVITNIGGGYNPTTGKFTCPEAGVYQFLIHVTSQYDRLGWFYLMHNDKQEVRVRTDSNNGYQVASNSAVISLAKGDTVYVKTGGTAYVYGLHYPITTFTGILLSSA